MTTVIASLGLLIALVATVVAVVACVRTASLAGQLTSTRRLLREIDRDLEALGRRFAALHRDQPHPEPPPLLGEPETPADSSVERLTPVAPAPARHAPPPLPSRHRQPPTPQPIDWEKFIGRRVLGWVAVGLVVLAASFFIKHAFDTVFGPTARVATGAVIGIALCLAGGRSGVRGQIRGCSMFCSAGLLVLYLSVYVSFGYYTLLRPATGGMFLTMIVAEGVLLSIWYRARPLAYLALAGALLVPALVPADEDRYAAFFIYLSVVNVAAAFLTRSVSHPGLGLLTFLGSQILFWAWFAGRYHPEKMWAVVAVQTGLYAAWMLAGRFTRVRAADGERVVMWLATGLFFFLTLHRIVDDEAAEWRGTLAVAFSLWYAILARLALPAASKDMIRIATLSALAFGFLGVAIPLQSSAPWTAVGWAVIGSVLWWFGLRVREPFLRVGGMVFLMASLISLAWMWVDGEADTTMMLPLFNPRSLPMLGVAGCLLAVALSTRRSPNRLTDLDLVVRHAAGLGTAALVWIVLTWETLHTGNELLSLSDTETQTGLSIIWAAYAATLLAAGFVRSLPSLRWIGLGLLVVTVLKLIGYDLSELPAIYRALTFLAVAVVMAAAAWGYQRFARAGKEADHD
ncbi:DUF2339 domain-containing protein [Zavarzinella formosa]|uniref:DUF2339 domain-containing protein n=1 Tax=Zavarzinella formosa TaxID=360055 RepID=UPI0003039D9B|nr:DUF2339 domain-containing protein [Zavarzinella formosa]